MTNCHLSQIARIFRSQLSHSSSVMVTAHVACRTEMNALMKTTQGAKKCFIGYFSQSVAIFPPLVVAILLWIGTRTSDRLSSVPLVPLRKLRPPLRKLRPSQFLPLGASMSPLGFRGLGFSFGGPGYKSDEETLEDMVALREKRLAELKGGPPPSVSGSARNSPRE